MRAWRTPAVGLLALFAALGAFAPAANGDETALERALHRLRFRLFVKNFQVGHLEPNTDRFLPVGGDGAEGVRRDAVVMIVFSEPISLARVIPGNPSTAFVHINDRSVRIGIPSENGLLFHAPGQFYQYVEKEWDPQQGFVPKRAYADRILFDPTRRFSDPSTQTPEGLKADSLYSVTVPTIEHGARKTVRTRDGARIGRTFTATFRTGYEYYQDYTQPRVVGVESDFAPGVEIEGRTDVEPGSAIVARFSEAMRPESFVAGVSFQIRDVTGGTLIPGQIEVSEDLRAFTYRPFRHLGIGPREIEVTVTQEVLDLAGNYAVGATIRFTTRPGGP